MLMLHTLRSCYKLLAEGLFYSRIRLYETPGVQDALLQQHERLYKAVMDGNPDEAREAARHHMDYVEKTLSRTNQAGAWEEISRMRLSQMADRSDKTQKVRKSTNGRSSIRSASKAKATVNSTGEKHSSKGEMAN
jgi:GntR family transcriptional repressor for pyruvate dehydrogenase complex